MSDLFGAGEGLPGPAVREGAAPGAWPRGDAPDPGLGARAFSVSDVNALVRELLESAVPPLWVSGEVTGWKRYPSGHCYFTLRDSQAQLRCVMFRGEARRLPTDPEEGMEVRALGTVTVYERRGDFQLVVRELEGSGAGGLWRVAFERLRARLEAEGLLAPERKRPLPPFPAAVAVVTSPVGAALHDILTVVARRAPWVRVILSPARVQGDGAAEEVARAVGLVGRAGGADILIVGRGGGSVEDLWAFNEEVVARAIAASPVPVISAVGHEVDVTIADLVADVRAPTPSAAAERAVPDRAAVARQLEGLGAALEAACGRLLAERRGQLLVSAQGLTGAMREVLRARRERLGHLAARLDGLSPLAVLRRGYAVPLGGGGRVLRRAAEFEPGAPFRLRVVDGHVDCRVDGSVPSPPGEATDE